MITVIEHTRDARTPLRADIFPTNVLVLSCLVRVDFHAPPGPRSPRGCLLREVAQASSTPFLYRYSSALHAGRLLLEFAGASVRFGGLRVCDAVTRLTSQPLAQFSAVTFVDEAGATYVVLHGTNASAVGWAEGARFGFDLPTDSQLWVANYLVFAVARANGPLTVVGHSKGVNLMLYVAAATIPPALKHVYTFDPMGFLASVTDDGLFLGIDGRVHVHATIGPWVSPLLPLSTPATVATSPWSGPLSHNPYAWRSQGSILAPDHWRQLRFRLILRDILTAVLRARPMRIDTNYQHQYSRWTPGPFHTHVGPFPHTPTL